MGVNVWFWGPCLWACLNATARCVDLMTAAAQRGECAPATVASALLWATRFVTAALAVAPCPFCRDSSQLFLRELEAEWGEPMGHVFAKGHALRFLHMLHSKVNMKLHAQHLGKFLPQATAQATAGDGLAFGDRCCTVPPREVSFDTFYRRTMLRQRLFTVEDVLWLLHAVRLDFDAARAPSLLQFLHGLSTLVTMDAATFDGDGHTIMSAAAPMRKLQGVMQPLVTQVHLQPELLTAQAGVDRLVLLITAGLHNVRVTRHNAAALQSKWFAPYQQMKVGVVCATETCSVPPPAPPRLLRLAAATGRPQADTRPSGGP